MWGEICEEKACEGSGWTFKEYGAWIVCWKHCFGGTKFKFGSVDWEGEFGEGESGEGGIEEINNKEC